MRKTYAKWNADEGWLYAAAVAAFAALALAPLLVITLHFVEALGGGRTARHALAILIDPIVGHGGVRALSGVTANAPSTRDAAAPIALAVAVALFSGSRLFYALQRALHVMWETEHRRVASAGHTFLSFLAAGVLSVCFVAVLAIVIFGSGLLIAAARGSHANAFLASVGVRAAIAVLGALVLAPIVAALFRWLPGNDLTWGDVWIGASTTAVGFAAAQFLIGVYLARVDLPVTYGSAASIVVVLLWLYYSAYLFLLGAEFTQVYACELGSQRGGRRARKAEAKAAR